MSLSYRVKSKSRVYLMTSWRCLGPVGMPVRSKLSEGDDAAPEPGVWGQHAVVAVAVDAGWRDQPGEGVQKLEGREGE